MSYQSEAHLENNMIDKLIKQGYEKVRIPNEDALIQNFRTQINRFNEKKLKGKPLADIEFNRLLTMIDGKSVFESAKIV
ncbi:hypothetical protein ORD22_06780 [Sporosarcina sp. GW1-11]|uniref:hypothetical protein n=1 Tax=Sporosarcina sp. GW1-11 TaxID=2899126 RepID=UPI00294CDDAB|nr:hypothetical protein [Sporosarcina sp. GW1-11]MDV6377967.1 hypothetical protein [Sporosarcina sp. GW1-11]